MLVDSNPAFEEPSMILLEQIFMIDKSRISIIMDENVWNKMKDTGAWNLSPESCNKPSGGIFVFHYLFRRGKPWYTERNESNESKVINREVPL